MCRSLLFKVSLLYYICDSINATQEAQIPMALQREMEHIEIVDRL